MVKLRLKRSHQMIVLLRRRARRKKRNLILMTVMMRARRRKPLSQQLLPLPRRKMTLTAHPQLRKRNFIEVGAAVVEVVLLVVVEVVGVEPEVVGMEEEVVVMVLLILGQAPVTSVERLVISPVSAPREAEISVLAVVAVDVVVVEVAVISANVGTNAKREFS
jgi:hypothetical protein